MTVSSSGQRLFPSISKAAIDKASKALSKTGTATTIASEKLLTDFKTRADGVFYRSIENMRNECSQLTYTSKLRDTSASVIAGGTAHQSVYAPDWIPAVGFLISGNAPVSAMSRGLFLETPRDQSPSDIQDIREDIVSRLKQGDASTPHQATQFYAPRQSGVNEAHISYGTDDVAAYALPLKSADDLAECLTGTPISSNTDATEVRKAADHLRLVSQLAYAVSKLGAKPVFCFAQGQLNQVNLSKADWADLLSRLNELGENKYLLKVAENPADYDRRTAMAVSSAAEQLMALEKTIDIHDVKHMGGAFTRIPVDVALAVSSVFTDKKS